MVVGMPGIYVRHTPGTYIEDIENWNASDDLSKNILEIVEGKEILY